MKAHQSIRQTMIIRPSELFFGILMLVIIFLTSGYPTSASTGASVQQTEIKNYSDDMTEQLKWEDVSRIEKEQHVNGDVSVPLMIMILLIISYSALSGSIYLVQELKK